MTKITTNETVVSSLSKEMLQATQEVNVSLKKSISYSSSDNVKILSVRYEKSNSGVSNRR
ncbi:hypothetical protein [Carnobacterium divergens]|uniref:hypothetical protein n=1 Tax=Carnobacterium divergens TaxID=2748 RepID=UPI0007F46F89|nr:hypothetical protein [Carnobacterium divergens]SBO17043.1 hypothetical protein CDIV41_270057 [Carnobacterium divergens]